MRIVAGAARGRRLDVPRGHVTRPTTDRVRESLFASIESRMGGCSDLVVLDLFAGSGALGLEALSRGARSAVFIESDRRVIGVLRRNIAAVGLPGAQVVGDDAWRFAAGRGVGVEVTGPFDLVLCDPPYDITTDRVRKLLSDLVARSMVAADGLIVVERSARDDESPWPDSVPVESLDRRTYGETALWYGRLRGEIDLEGDSDDESIV